MRISSNLLADTLNLVQLAHETALERGNQEQAQRLDPVVSQLKGIASQTKTARPSSSAASTQAAAASKNDFRTTLLSSLSDSRSPVASTPAQNVMERNRIVQAMSASNMGEIDIAKQMGISREEVQLVLRLGQHNRAHQTDQAE